MLTYLPTVCYIYPVIYESLEYRQLETAQYVLFWTDDVTVSTDGETTYIWRNMKHKG